KVKPTPFTLRTIEIDKDYEEGIAPYAFRAEFGEVMVELLIGFYRVPPDMVDDEDESRTAEDQAGWTVLCNDRAVLYRDKTMLTGWGEADVPSYHPQFSTIAGIVRFWSKTPTLLPITTTKHGVDASSEIYLETKDKMREGLKKFTSFT